MKKILAVIGLIVGGLAALAVVSFAGLMAIVRMIYPYGYIPAFLTYFAAAVGADFLRTKYRKAFGIRAPAFFSLVYAPSVVTGILAMLAARLMYDNGVIDKSAPFEAMWFVSLALALAACEIFILSLAVMFIRFLVGKIAKRRSA